jgi:hypothetical protein
MRLRSYRAADQLVGKWTAHNMLDGRTVDRARKMDGSGDTIISTSLDAGRQIHTFFRLTARIFLPDAIIVVLS